MAIDKDQPKKRPRVICTDPNTDELREMTEMTDDELKLADIVRREKEGKCMHKCGTHPEASCADTLKWHKFHRCERCLS